MGLRDGVRSGLARRARGLSSFWSVWLLRGRWFNAWTAMKRYISGETKELRSGWR